MVVERTGPGTRTLFAQIGKGPTTLANNTEVTVLAGHALAAGDLPLFFVNMREAPASEVDMFQGDTGANPGNDNMDWGLTKLASGLIDFRIRQREGAPREIDWVALRGTPR